MSDQSPDSPPARPARPAIPPFRGGPGPAGAGRPPLAPARPASPASATTPSGGRPALRPFAAPGGTARRVTPGPLATGGSPSHGDSAASGASGERPATPRLGIAAASDAPFPAQASDSGAGVGTSAAGVGGELAGPAALDEARWLSPDTAVRGEFGDLVEHRPSTPTRAPALPTPPMPWPAVRPEATDDDADGAAALDAEFAAIEAASVDGGEAVPGASAASIEGSDSWTRGYEAEAAALLGDGDAAMDASAEPEAYLADDAGSATGDPAIDGALHPSMHASMLPTPVIGAATADRANWEWPEEAEASPPRAAAPDRSTPVSGADAALRVAPPDPLLEDAMRGDAADAWNDPLADEPLGGVESQGDPMGAYRAGTPYLVPAQEETDAESPYASSDANAVAEALERVATWVRSGDLVVSVPPAQAPSETQALTAALAALLGLGAQR